MVNKKNKDDDSMFKSENVGKSKPRKKSVKRVKKEVITEESTVSQYVHPNNKRKNNPPVGMVDPNNDPDRPSKRYSFDPRLDPQLQWSGKTENSEFDVDTVSLHVHERIDPLTIIEKAMKEHKQVQQSLFRYFEMPENNPPLREAIEFYKHNQNWSNRFIAGDSLLVMNSLLEKESMNGKVQMIYFDPPYGIKFGSNFQPFSNKREVKDKNDDDLTHEVETIKAFRDTWELSTHSYLSYLRDRLLLSHKLLTESGSCFLQINDDNLHLVRNIMDEIFGKENFVNIIPFKKRASFLDREKGLFELFDYIVWYAKDFKKIKFRQLYTEKKLNDNLDEFKFIDIENDVRKITIADIMNPDLDLSKVFRTHSAIRRNPKPKNTLPLIINGQKVIPPTGFEWKADESGMKNLLQKNRLYGTSPSRMFRIYFSDFPFSNLTNVWNDTIAEQFPIYAVQTDELPIQRCILMTTDPGDLVFDPTCGSGTTAFVSEQWGRRWITTDTSRVAITLAKKRLLTSEFPYYTMSHPDIGIDGGFIYKKVSHSTLKSVADDKIKEEKLIFDAPEINKNIKRICGPFTIEAVPSPMVKSIDALSEETPEQVQTKIITQKEWRDELLKTGIRGRGDQRIEFSRIETHPTSKWIHAVAETKEEKPKHVVIAFGPEHAPLEQRQVERVFEESRSFQPKPEIIIFAAMQFDAEAAKDIDKKDYSGVTLLKAEMNKDLQNQDLKKNQSTSESFWLMGSPDVECKKQKDGKYIVTVNGFDYYNTKTDEIESGGASKIAIWELDTDYDGRSVYPQQVFFPMDGKSGGWSKLAKTLHAEIDDDLITKYQGIESIPFEAGLNKRVAVKIIDDRGIESLKIIDLE